MKMQVPRKRKRLIEDKTREEEKKNKKEGNKKGLIEDRSETKRGLVIYQIFKI